ncbi:PQQ-binding-like beta-propeller repeat protein [Novipirellula sp. SH528]|uniref:PQQ-binding-like beta-propeller repeat protein n=1 Tax=Novipirellula sp. SH528 TaxID=3454466 RepID=UPI003F9F8CF3
MLLRYFNRCRLFSLIAAACFAGIAASEAVADDWPGWMGPSRDGVYRETGIIDEVPESGLKVKWRTPIAGGYAGPAVADGRVFVFDYEKTEGEAFNDAGQRANLKGQERLTALDAETGKQLWQYAYDRPYSISYPAGPRCTPTVDGDLVYILGSEGDLQALRVSDGEVVWKRNLPEDLGAEVPIWGFAAHPLIDGDMLYTMVGGEGQAIVAFDKLTGEVKWKAIDGNAGYCTPSIIEHGGARQLIVYHPTAVTSLNPTTGREYWSIPIAPSFDMSIARPMVDGDLMYASGIRSESLMIQLGSDSPAAKEVWRGEPKEAVHSANATPIFTEGVVYGTDCVQGNLVAVDAKDGSQLWSTFEATRPDEKRFIKHGTAFLTRLADTDRYLIFSETGDLQMAKLTAAGYEDLGRFHVLQPTGEAFGRSVVWSHPAYAGQTAFARNDEEIVAVDLAK